MCSVRKFGTNAQIRQIHLLPISFALLSALAHFRWSSFQSNPTLNFVDISPFYLFFNSISERCAHSYDQLIMTHESYLTLYNLITMLATHRTNTVDM